MTQIRQPNSNTIKITIKNSRKLTGKDKIMEKSKVVYGKNGIRTTGL